MPLLELRLPEVDDLVEVLLQPPGVYYSALPVRMRHDASEKVSVGLHLAGDTDLAYRPQGLGRCFLERRTVHDDLGEKRIKIDAHNKI